MQDDSDCKASVPQTLSERCGCDAFCRRMKYIHDAVPASRLDLVIFLAYLQDAEVVYTIPIYSKCTL